MANSITSLPYADRQFVVVADDSVIEAERKAAEQASTKKNSDDWTQLALPILIKIIAGTNVVGIALDAAVQAYKSWKQMRENWHPRSCDLADRI